MKYQFDEAKKLIVEALDLAHDEAREDLAIPELLFHYTNAKGLHGILSSKTLWATGFQFLNRSF
jgi:hypothetical protein